MSGFLSHILNIKKWSAKYSQFQLCTNENCIFWGIVIDVNYSFLQSHLFLCTYNQTKMDAIYSISKHQPLLIFKNYRQYKTNKWLLIVYLPEFIYLCVVCIILNYSTQTTHHPLLTGVVHTIVSIADVISTIELLTDVVPIIAWHIM